MQVSYLNHIFIVIAKLFKENVLILVCLPGGNCIEITLIFQFEHFLTVTWVNFKLKELGLIIYGNRYRCVCFGVKMGDQNWEGKYFGLKMGHEN